MALVLSWRNKPTYEHRRFILTDTQQRWSEPMHRFLGFGYESDSQISWLQAPMWFVALLAAMPALWFYRRQRKKPKSGFPVELNQAVGAASATAEAPIDGG